MKLRIRFYEIENFSFTSAIGKILCIKRQCFIEYPVIIWHVSVDMDNMDVQMSGYREALKLVFLTEIVTKTD